MSPSPFVLSQNIQDSKEYPMSQQASVTYPASINMSAQHVAIKNINQQLTALFTQLNQQVNSTSLKINHIFEQIDHRVISSAIKIEQRCIQLVQTIQETVDIFFNTLNYALHDAIEHAERLAEKLTFALNPASHLDNSEKEKSSIWQKVMVFFEFLANVATAITGILMFTKFLKNIPRIKNLFSSLGGKGNKPPTATAGHIDRTGSGKGSKSSKYQRSRKSKTNRSSANKRAKKGSRSRQRGHSAVSSTQKTTANPSNSNVGQKLKKPSVSKITKRLDIGSMLTHAINSPLGKIARWGLKIGRFSTPLGWASIAAETLLTSETVKNTLSNLFTAPKNPANNKPSEQLTNLKQDISHYIGLTPPEVTPQHIESHKAYTFYSQPTVHIHVPAGVSPTQIRSVQEATKQGLYDAEQHLLATINGGIV